MRDTLEAKPCLSITPWVGTSTTMEFRMPNDLFDHLRSSSISKVNKSHPSTYERSFSIGFVRRGLF